MLVDDYPVRILMDSEVQEVAGHWRAQLNQYFLSNALDIPELFAAVGKAVGWPIKVEQRPDEGMGRANAFVSPDRRTVYFRTSLVEAAAAGDPEAVFDATHELAHVILHRAEIPLARMATRNNQHNYLQPEESAEHQANVFARSFLMTNEEVIRFPAADVLSEECYVPFRQAELRLKEYGRTAGRKVRAAKLREELLEAKLKGYAQTPCTECLHYTLLHSGSCLTCDTCGATSGCS